jgi:hypothetical protein
MRRSSPSSKSSAAEQSGLRRASRPRRPANSRLKSFREYRATISWIARREISPDLAPDTSHETPASTSDKGGEEIHLVTEWRAVSSYA